MSCGTREGCSLLPTSLSEFAVGWAVDGLPFGWSWCFRAKLLETEPARLGFATADGVFAGSDLLLEELVAPGQGGECWRVGGCQGFHGGLY
jgi:hypothetical protein